MAGGILLLGSSAFAQQATAPIGGESKKQLTEMELYTRGALDNAKVLYESAEMPQGPTDKTLWREGVSNISRSIAKVQDHLGQFKRTLGSASLGKDPMAKKPDDLQTHLRAAKTALSKLSSQMSRADRAEVRDQASTVYMHLSAANDTIKDMLSACDVQSIDKITPPEKLPVRGVEKGNVDHDSDHENLEKAPPQDLQK
jgi:hypothetical protein